MQESHREIRQHVLAIDADIVPRTQAHHRKSSFFSVEEERDFRSDVVAAQKQDNTTLTRAFSGKLARGIRNKFIDCMQAKQENILDYPIQNALTKTMRQKAKEMDSTEFMSMWAGQSAWLCRNMCVRDLMSKLISEVEEASHDNY